MVIIKLKKKSESHKKIAFPTGDSLNISLFKRCLFEDDLMPYPKLLKSTVMKMSLCLKSCEVKFINTFSQNFKRSFVQLENSL